MFSFFKRNAFFRLDSQDLLVFLEFRAEMATCLVIGRLAVDAVYGRETGVIFLGCRAKILHLLEKMR
jgi:hypothetical protein